MTTINFKYANPNEEAYILTLDGREIGRVYELELAQMIEEISSRKEITELELTNETQAEEISRLEDNLSDANEKIQELTDALTAIQKTLDSTIY